MWASRHYENVIAVDETDALRAARAYCPQGWFPVSAVECNSRVADHIVAKYAALGKRIFAVHCHRTGVKHLNCRGVGPSLPAGPRLKNIVHNHVVDGRHWQDCRGCDLTVRDVTKPTFVDRLRPLAARA